MTTRLRLHISPCPNDTFMFDALIHNRIDCGGLRFEVEYHDIEELNGNARRGVADISKISYAVLPALLDRYRLLDSGSALGRGNGPLLVRRLEDEAPIRRVAVPGLDTTANALLARLYPELTQKEPVLFSEIARAVESGQFDAGVLIHEGRFVYTRHRLRLVADLGAEWERTTGLPLPLGAIVVSRTLPAAVQSQIERSVRESVLHAMSHPDESLPFIREHARELDKAVIDAHVRTFVNDFSISLGCEGRQAVERLLGIAPGTLDQPLSV